MEESMNNPNAYWLHSIPALDRQAVDAVANWLRPVPWQWFATFTLSGNIREETATGKLRNFANDLEKFLRKNICFVAGQESKSCLYGLRIPWHFHLLLASYSILSKEAIEATWLRQVGRRSGQGKIQESVLVEPYEAHRLGSEYCLKQMNDANSGWHLHRLEHFLPDLPNPSKPNHRTLRSARRARQQAAPSSGCL
jgi:hypothetical protein